MLPPERIAIQHDCCGTSVMVIRYRFERLRAHFPGPQYTGTTVRTVRVDY